MSCSLFTYTDPAPTEIYTLSLHDALPILRECCHMGQLLLEFLLRRDAQRDPAGIRLVQKAERLGRDRIAERGGCCNRFGLDRKSVVEAESGAERHRATGENAKRRGLVPWQ